VARIQLDVAISEVAARDPVLAHLVATIGPIEYLPRSDGAVRLRRTRDHRRLDAWPVADLDVREGFGLVCRIDPAPTPKQLRPLGDPFRPYRSIVARYCQEAVFLHRGGTDV
jgi:hypothetical protein